MDILFMALIGFLIGWFTNFLAIKMIFRPLHPWKIPLVNITIQGLIPKRRYEIAKSIAQAVEEHLFSLEELLDEFLRKYDRSQILDQIKQKIVNVIDAKIPSFIPQSIKKRLLNYVAEVVEKETEAFINEIIENAVHTATQYIKVSELVESKINQLDLLMLEKILLSIASKELKYIEILGGILGFMIGFLQALILRIV